ncbi:1-phosphofructokinase family hexose kinase [Chitinasiproducens palmae]|uniref:Phosphofructokinase n=1 Tax=Chitinasiproducens palmae TaxID=1770053 RepID=A0A1H2PK25_9BURK|nr:1-phosphofructokinase family hexose kinase [Chitinasiproducens palmae]SDV46747.1 fructose-1-phosphate kinase [Chitinasiproducens palmae]
MNDEPQRKTAGRAQAPGCRQPVVCVTAHPALDQTVQLARLVAGEVHRASSSRLDAGGKGVNVAACLADYDCETISTGLLGTLNAAPFEALFAAKGMSECFLRGPASCRTNIKIVDLARGETTDINVPGTVADSDRLAALADRVVALAEPGRWIVLAGSLPPGAPEDWYGSLLPRLRARGALVALDTSGAPLRLALQADRQALPTLIKPNRAELSELLGAPLGDEASLRAAAETLLARGVAAVVVSLGAAGAFGLRRAPAADWDCEGFVATPLPVEPLSTVGAGDAFLAGLIASLIEQREWAECGRRATAFAAGKLARIGPHLPSRDTLDALAARVRVRAFRCALYGTASVAGSSGTT